MQTRWWSTQSDQRILCELCPRACRLKDGDRGFCFVRSNRGGKMVLETYGKSTGFCIDPIEKKPLNHFLPGTPVLSFGTAGCNLGCKFCQNWDISKSRQVEKLSNTASPMDIAIAAEQAGCRSVAYTYNDPVIWAEYAIDTASECRRRGIKSVAVTAGYISPDARGPFFDSMDAANIDLKAFSEDFYFKLTSTHLDPVLDTIRYVCNETDVWVELTNLVIPMANDSLDEVRRMCDWILDQIGDSVPIHFTAFHPDFRMTDRDRTPHETLIKAYATARAAGIRYIYLGNVHDVARQSTYCPECQGLVIERDWHQLGAYHLEGNRCQHCNHEIAGHFEAAPGTWGRQRQPIQIQPQRTPIQKPKIEIPSPQEANMLNFSETEKSAIHRAACRLVIAAVSNQQAPNDLEESLASREVDGVFVTLKRNGVLRGCCGAQAPNATLGSALAQSAHRTATSDPRMSPVALDELAYLTLTVSILDAPQSVTSAGAARANEVEIGKHGVRIQQGRAAGLLLPSVAREMSWNSHQYLDAVCRKAGLPAGSWLRDDVDLKIFEGIDFSAPLELEHELPSSTHLFTVDQMRHYQQWVRGNIDMILRGGTPMYYAQGVDDATVAGIALQVTPEGSEEPINSLQFAAREGFPLQSTLFQMLQKAAQALASARQNVGKVNIAFLSSPIHHGTGSQHDFQGVDASNRAVILRDAKRFAMCFDRTSRIESNRDTAYDTLDFRTATTQTHSVVCDCSSESMLLPIGPKSISTFSTRLPAVAGTFYPQDDAARTELIEGFLRELPECNPKPVKSAMVPHAGLKYSGRIATDVWRRIDLPDTVIIIGPKHTGDGLDWAVAPAEKWHLSSTASLDGAPELAASLADAVPGMQLDALAHAAEHGIEVQLPIIHHLSPNTRVIGIAMNGGSIDDLSQAADAMAKWIANQEQRPLIVISSDMNHFANDEENRRRDRLALQQLENLNPEGLLKTCADESISMCGQIPAAFTLMTLRALGESLQYDEIGYATSAETNQNKDRVVGYAGVLF